METKKERREIAREKAREAREQAAKKKRRNRLFIQGGIGAALVAAAVVVGLVVVNTANTGPVVSPKNMASGGIVLQANKAKDDIVAVTTKASEKQTKTEPFSGTGPIKIVEYVDPQCPYCKQFEETNSSQIAGWVASGKATLEIHPISLPSLDAASNGNHYSSRAVNALACVANYQPNTFYQTMVAMFANQPEEGTSGMTDDQLINVLQQAQVTAGKEPLNEKVPECVTNQTYKKWVSNSSTKALTETLPNTNGAKLTGTPSVFVNGKQYNDSTTDAAKFTDFVTKTALETSTATATPNTSK